MSGIINKVLVVGLGKVGSLVGTLLKRSGFEVSGADARAVENLPFPGQVLEVSDSAALGNAMLQGCPGHREVDAIRQTGDDTLATREGVSKGSRIGDFQYLTRKGEVLDRACIRS